VRVDALVGLLQRQRDPTTLQVDVDDLDEHLVVDLRDLLGHLHVALGQLGDVHQALDTVLDAHERTERHQLGDLTGHDLTDRVRAGEGLPRVLLGGLQRERDPLPVEVHVEHLDGDLLADLDDLVRVVDVLPGQLGDVHQTVDTAEVHERTEVDDRGHHTGAHLALLQGLQEGGAHLGLGLLQPGAAGQHHVVAVLVQLDDLRLELLADVGLQVADATHLHQRGGQEAAEADVQDETTLDHLDDGAGDDAVLLLDLLDGAPGALVLGALLRQEQTALLVLLLQDEGLDAVSDGDDLIGVDVVLDGELAGKDDAFGLVTDVEENLVTVDLDDRTLDDVTVIEVLDGRVDGCEELFFRADVVDRDLRDIRRGRAGDSHTVVNSVADRDSSWTCGHGTRVTARTAAAASIGSRRRPKPQWTARLAATSWAQERTNHLNYPTARGEQGTMGAARSGTRQVWGRARAPRRRCRAAGRGRLPAGGRRPSGRGDDRRVEPRRRGLPGRARRAPRRRGLPLVSGGAAGGGRPPARSPDGAAVRPGAGGGRRGGAVL